MHNAESNVGNEDRGVRRCLAPVARPGNLRRLCTFVPLALCPFLLFCRPVAALEQVTVKYQEKQIQLEGRLTVEAKDGGLMLLAPDGVLWPIQPVEIVKRFRDDRPFEPLAPKEIAQRVLAGLPAGFAAHTTAHYVICYNTSPEYAKWCGSLFEQLYRAFFTYWTHRGVALREPEFPLVALVFADRAAYIRYAEAEAGAAAQTILGYYNMQTNRMAMCDLTGVQAQGKPAGRRGTLAEINQVLSRPDAERTVATIVHEATHQIAYNCGLHVRYSDCPRWFSEGIAIFFETPDLASTKGWRNVGAVNRPRHNQFRQYLRKRPADSLAQLLTDDRRFREPQQALDAYAEAWALTYFLLRQKPKLYVDYLRVLAEKKPCIDTPPAERIAEFTRVFGDLRKLDAELVRAMGK